MLKVNFIFFFPGNTRTFGSRYSRMDQLKFAEDSLSRPYHFKFLKGCLPQNYLAHS